jgi:ribonuclease HI
MIRGFAKILKKTKTPVSTSKESMPKTYYAVKAGRNPGIYSSWVECKKQTHQFSNAVFKGFTTYEGAVKFLSNSPVETVGIPLSARFNAMPVSGGGNVHDPPSVPHGQVSHSHHVQVVSEVCPSANRPSQASTSNESSPPSASNVPFSAQPSFSNQSTSNHSTHISNPSNQSDIPSLPSVHMQPMVTAGAMRRNKTRVNVNPYDASKRKVRQPVAIPQLPAPITPPSKTAVVYVDGACSNNGRPGAVAGYGCYFPLNDYRISRPLLPRTQPQTNQRAELMAAIVALEEFPDRHDRSVILTVRTDSTYCINCARDWVQGWKKNGWKTSKGGDVENSDLIIRLHHLCEERRGRLVWEHIRGHSGDVGNEIADQLAVDGARL